MKLWLAAIASLLVIPAAYATPAWTFTSAGNSYTNGSWAFGTAFTVNSDVTASGLGYYADPVTGNVNGNTVGLYQCADVACSTTGTLLAQVNVTNTYALNDFFRYVTINPINLTAGTSYEVVGVSLSDNYTWNDPGFTVNPAISLISDGNGNTTRWTSGTSLTFLNSIQNDLTNQDGYWGPNVFLGQPTFASVPEPASFAVVGFGLAALGLVRRRRRA
ncbi:MAG: DUF4082 domain-containing protein [Rhodospirillales bacterium]|nr:DUF4082 domain-containing protein [Rhodospirillales bacterium]